MNYIPEIRNGCDVWEQALRPLERNTPFLFYVKIVFFMFILHILLKSGKTENMFDHFTSYSSFGYF